MNPKNKKSLIGFVRPLGPLILMVAVLFVNVKMAMAQSAIGPDWAQFLKGVPGFSSTEGLTGQDLAANFVRNGIRIVRYVMGAAALILAIFYGATLVNSRGDEEAIAKSKNNFLWIFIGFIILMMSEQVAAIFNPETSSIEQLIDFKSASDQLRDISNYMKWLLGSIIVLLMTLSGARLITAGGDEETIDKQKTYLTWSGLGMLLVLLADNIVNAIYVVEQETGIFQGLAAPKTGIQEIAGIIRLILVFMGPMAILFTIYAGYLYLTAMDDEERAGNAKKMIVGGITGIALTYGAYALVNTLVKAPLG